jgi:hypothetical protein
VEDLVIRVALALAYGPLIVMAGLWIAAALLRLMGQPAMSDWLARRTSIPSPEVFEGAARNSH